MKVECHPFHPFLPEGARVLMLGTFPPAEKRWAMPFYYPNLQNDMWRIVGLCFFNDKQHFIAPDGRYYRQQELERFLAIQGIALYDTCTKVIRTTGTASDKDLQVVEKTDLKALVSRLPKCRAIATTGALATTLVCEQLGVQQEPPLGGYATVNLDGRELRLYRMPSSSRAYPLPIEQKAAHYQRLFSYVG
ncbi:MAG: uracil-DNA glycosylase family protein [Prevotella sp.]|nr:uracil-DNA glycosylase family protein [Prevotella sp.]